MKRNTAVLLCCLLVLGGCAGEQHSEPDAVQLQNMYNCVYGAVSDGSVNAGESAASENAFPDYFSGAVQEGESVTVYVTDDRQETLKSIAAALNNDDFAVQKVQYSMNELQKTQQRFDEWMKTRTAENVPEDEKDISELSARVVGYGIDVLQNRFVVHIAELSDRDLQILEQYFEDYAGIDFELGYYMIK